MQWSTTRDIYCHREVACYCFNDGYVVYVLCCIDIQQLVVQVVHYNVMVQDPKYRSLYSSPLP